MTTLLDARAIEVRDALGNLLLHPLDLSLNAGEPLVVLGETGSGKSLLAQALLGTLPSELSARGQVTLAGRALNAAQPQQFQPYWGRDVALLPQEPWLSLDPLMRAQQQIVETHRLVASRSGTAARAAAARDLTGLGLSDAGKKYPHQLSGGMAQRVAFAAARAGGAGVVIADEPTKGLDAARRDDVASLLLDQLDDSGGLLVITHDLALARRIGGRIMIVRDGAAVETGATTDVFAAPQADYTRQLIAADPIHWPQRQTDVTATPLLEATALTLARGGHTLQIDVDVAVGAGEIVGVTGPSGCGKSTLGDALLGLHNPGAGTVRRLVDAPRTAFQKLYQDPVAAFPRRRRLGRTLGDVARRFNAPEKRIDELMDVFGLASALLERRPEQVSGGELQRLSLLRVMLCRPKFLFADEPTSRLDPITQAEVIALLVNFVNDGCGLLIVSHDITLIDKIADRVLYLQTAAS